ncbi:MAG: hypothetical protein ACN4GT_08350 [Gammaproteobacteria bacterium]
MAAERLVAASFALIMLAITGCSSPGSEDGVVVGTITDDGAGNIVVSGNIVLPTDTLLNLACEDVGIAPQTCVLTDPENPFINAGTTEFNVNDPDAETKFDLLNQIPAGPAGAKARFYLWATALARFPSGENQWYTARALHELWDAAGDPIIQVQALRAYRAVLDNFFGSVTFFECCAGLIPGDPATPVPFSVPLNELTADNLYRTESTGWARLIPGDPLLTQSIIASWGYTYQPATPPDFNDGVVSVNVFP